MCSLADGDRELTGIIFACPIDAKHISLVAVMSLIERPHEENAGLDGNNTARPGNLFHFRLCAYHRLSLAQLNLQRTWWMHQYVLLDIVILRLNLTMFMLFSSYVLSRDIYESSSTILVLVL